MPNQITNGLSQTKSNKQSLSNFYLKPAFDKSPTAGHRMPLLLFFSFWEVTIQSDAKLQKTKGNFGKISSQFVNFTKFTVKSWSVYWVRRWLKTGQELTFMIYPQTSLSPTFCPNISEKELPLELPRLPNNGGAANQVGGEDILHSGSDPSMSDILQICGSERVPWQQECSQCVPGDSDCAFWDDALSTFS